MQRSKMWVAPMDYLKPDVWMAVEKQDYDRFLVDGHFEVSSPQELAEHFHQSEVGQTQAAFIESWAFDVSGRQYCIFKPMFSKEAFEANMLNLLQGRTAPGPVSIWCQSSVWIDDDSIITQSEEGILGGHAGDVWMVISQHDHNQLIVFDRGQRKFVLDTQAEMKYFRYSRAGETKREFLSRCCKPNVEYLVFGPFDSRKAIEQGLRTQLAEVGKATLHIFGGQWVMVSKTRRV